MKYKLLIIAVALGVPGPAVGGGLYLAYPVQVSTLAGLTRSYFISWSAPPALAAPKASRSAKLTSTGTPRKRVNSREATDEANRTPCNSRAQRHTGTTPLGRRPDGACNPSVEHHAGKSRPAPAHPLVGLCVYVGGICRAGRHDRHQSLLCRRAHGLNNCVGACHGIIVGISSRLLGLRNLPCCFCFIVASGLGVAVFVLGLPGRIAIARNHPEAEAVYLMGWIGFLAVVPWIQALSGLSSQPP